MFFYVLLREHTVQKDLAHILQTLMEAYLLLSIQAILNNMLRLHFRAQQSVSEASGVHVWGCSAVAFQHEHKTRGTDESPLTSVCQNPQIAFLYLPAPWYISALMTAAYCHLKWVLFYTIHFLSSLGKKHIAWLAKLPLLKLHAS